LQPAVGESVVYYDRDSIVYTQVSQHWRTNHLLPYRQCLNVHEKNMEKLFQTKKTIMLLLLLLLLTVM
jgi:hypothetical protein